MGENVEGWFLKLSKLLYLYLEKNGEYSSCAFVKIVGRADGGISGSLEYDYCRWGAQWYYNCYSCQC